MSVPDKIMHFRAERATELERMAKLLEETIGGNISSSTSKVYTAARQLRDKTYIHPFKDGKTSNDYWGYSIDDFVIGIPQPRHLSPSNVTNLNVSLTINLIAKCLEWEDLNDPLNELCFRVTLKGVGADSTYYSGFHIDKHDMSKKSDEPHPVYHLQYVVNPNNRADFNQGHFLGLDTPRIPHYPLDFILGIGFITSNFFPDAYNILMDNGLFVNLSKRYQERIWKPYFHTLASHWKPFQSSDITWQPTTHLCPTIL
jgi:hypothetical protein